ncbi:MAG: hypothetical protein AAF554_18560 [Bacteroidota bacterium]
MRCHVITMVLVLSMLNQELKSQEIVGTWLQEQIPNSISYPSINIVEINSTSLIAHDFDKEYSRAEIEIRDSKMILNDSLSINYRVLDHNIFEIYDDGTNEDDSPTSKFFRLEDTICPESSCPDLKKSSFELVIGNQMMVFTLGKTTTGEEVIIIDKPPIAADRVVLEKVKQTYFLSFYAMGYRTYAFPIKEIEDTSFTIFGVPENEGEFVARMVD